MSGKTKNAAIYIWQGLAMGAF